MHVLLFYLYFAEKYHFFEQQVHQIHEDKSEIVEKNRKKMKNKKEMSRETSRKARVGMIVYVWMRNCRNARRTNLQWFCNISYKL